MHHITRIGFTVIAAALLLLAAERCGGDNGSITSGGGGQPGGGGEHGDTPSGGSGGESAGGGAGGTGGAVVQAMFTLQAPALVPVPISGQHAFTIDVTRESGFTGAIDLSLQGLPTGVTAASVQVAAGATQGTLTLVASNSAAFGSVTDAMVTGASGGAEVSQPVAIRVVATAAFTDYSNMAANDWGQAVAVQSDGKIVIMGGTRSTMGFAPPRMLAVARLLSTGLPDTGFATSGKLRDSNGNDYTNGNEVAITSDGHIVVVGEWGSYLSGTPSSVLIAVITSAGALDSAFNSNGWLTAQYRAAGRDSGAHSVAVDGNEFVVSGYNSDGTNYDAFAARYTLTGALVSGFGSSGTLFLNGSGDLTSTTIARASSGQFYLLNADATAGATSKHVTRLSNAGAIDTSFGSSGTASFAGGYWISERAVLQSSGKPVVVHNDGSGKVTLHRLNTDGSNDATFTTNALNAFDTTYKGAAIAIDTTDRIWVGLGGRVYRLTADGALDTSFSTADGVDSGCTNISDLAVGSDGSVYTACTLDQDLCVAKF